MVHVQLYQQLGKLMVALLCKPVIIRHEYWCRCAGDTHTHTHREVVDLKAGMREAIDVVVARGERLEDLSEYTNTRADHFSSREPTGQ